MTIKNKFIWLTLFFLTLDYTTKIWAELTLKIGEQQVVLYPYLSWILIHNTGLSSSLFEDYPTFVLLVNFIAVSIVIFILIKYMTHSMMWYITSALIIAGGVGNFINRLLLGHVIDFIYIQGYSAIFNVADIEIRLGMVLIIIIMIKEFVSEKRQKKIKEL